VTEGNWPFNSQVLIIPRVLQQKIVLTLLLVVWGTEMDPVINILLPFWKNLLHLSVTRTLHQQAKGPTALSVVFQIPAMLLHSEDNKINTKFLSGKY
jgi:hypothetical protein